jgi:hypothetical protein
VSADATVVNVTVTSTKNPPLTESELTLTLFNVAVPGARMQPEQLSSVPVKVVWWTTPPAVNWSVPVTGLPGSVAETVTERDPAVITTT